MNSRERLLAAFYLEEPDMVPVSTYMSPYWLNWVDVQMYWSIAKKSEAIFRTGIKKGGVFLSKANLRVMEKSWKEGERIVRLTRIEAPKGTLQSISHSERGISWVKEPFVKTEEDIETWLSISYKPIDPDPSEYFIWDEKLGEHGFSILSLGDPISGVHGLFSQRGFVLNWMKNRKLMQNLLDIMAERVMDCLTALLEKGVRRFWSSGPEHIVPPFFNPRLFDVAVAPYHREMAKLIHSYGGIMYMHCHGSIRRVLSKFKETGIDALDTIDPPPQGDCELWEAKKVLGDKICLLGNVDSVRVMARGTPEIIEEAVKKCIKDGAPGSGYVLQPTSGTIVDTPIENILAFIKAGRKHGKY
ncbi:MAG: uroporphyrinogen decarboxylase family protein [Candidatus Bathyarchaeia archaeon]